MNPYLIRRGEFNLAGSPRELLLVDVVEDGHEERNVRPRGVVGQVADGFPVVVKPGPAGDEVRHNRITVGIVGKACHFE